MSILTKVLAGLCILASMVLAYYVSQNAFAHVARVKERDRWAEILNGQITSSDKALEALKKGDEGAVQRIQDQMKSDFARYQEVADARFAKLKADAQKAENANEQITKFRPIDSQAGKAQVNDLVKEMGPDVYRQRLRRYLLERFPELAYEEQKIAQEKASLVGIRERSKLQIAQLQDQLKQITKDVTDEEALGVMIKKENLERRLELARMMAELEDALAARNLAQSRAQDLEEQVKYAREKYARLVQENTELASKIRDKEVTISKQNTP